MNGLEILLTLNPVSLRFFIDMDFIEDIKALRGEVVWFQVSTMTH